MKLAYALAAVLLATSPAAAQTSPFRADRCPVPGTVRGYPVWVRAADGTTVDSAYAQALADAAARRWEPPSRRRASIPGLNRLRTRLLPPEPRWPDDWAPEPRHVALGQVTLRRAGRPEFALLDGSDDRAFDRSLEGIFRGGAPGAPELPRLPAGADSVRVVIGFGGAPMPGSAVVRFAAQQSPVRIVPGTLNVPRPVNPVSNTPPRATIKYDVDASGRLVAGSVEVLESIDYRFGESVQAALALARFTPAQSNCRPVPLSVVQTFGGR